MADSPRVQIDIADHVAVVTLSRPDKHNALDVAMFEGIVDAAQRLQTEAGVRAVVLHGAGPSFCSGLDVVSIMQAGGGVAGLTDRVEGDVPNWFQRSAYDWTTLPMPVIAAVHGNCFGGGLQIALGADIRIAAPAARLSVMEVKWGLVPDMAITRALPRLVGIDVAKELAWASSRVWLTSRWRQRARWPRRSPPAPPTPCARPSGCSTNRGRAAPLTHWPSRPSSSSA
jgi:enoyl-CoA hydratase/carnithine racemase